MRLRLLIPIVILAAALAASVSGVAQGGQSQEAQAEAWAKRLAEYAPDTKPGSKGEFGIPSMDVDKILATHKFYLEGKKLYEEFLATKIPPDAHWTLREAEYNLRTGLETYRQSIQNVVNDVDQDVRQGQAWIAEQRKKEKPLMHSSGRMEQFYLYMAALRKLLPADDPRRADLEGLYSKLLTDQEAVERAVLKSRKMKPDVYKGGDAASIKQLASRILAEDTERRYEEAQVKPPVKLLRTHITSATWDTESAVEWTDTTKSALQYRVSKGVFVQVAAMVGDNCFVYTLYIHRDTIGGATGNLVGHVMHRDRFLRENIPN
ncbi:MAG: hypothetical protein IT363_03380 [Methanoregulaceae archaeon]|nr:hypothetical protein [Methanoregulaceae archaeon]